MNLTLFQENKPKEKQIIFVNFEDSSSLVQKINDIRYCADPLINRLFVFICLLRQLTMNGLYKLKLSKSEIPGSSPYLVVVLTDLFFSVGRSRTDQMGLVGRSFGWSRTDGGPTDRADQISVGARSVLHSIPRNLQSCETTINEIFFFLLIFFLKN